MFDFASSVRAFVARSCNHDTIRAQDAHQTDDTAIPWSSMTRLQENGFLADTLIATDQGWQAVGQLVPGNLVGTFDHGYRPVLDVKTVEIDPKIIPDRKATLIFVPAGALGNHRDMHVLPMQELVIELDEAEALHGDPFVPVPAHLLEGYRGIHKTRFDSAITVVTLGFAREEILHSKCGLLAISNASQQISPDRSAKETDSARYHRLPQIQLMRLINAKKKPAHPAFSLCSIDETYAALERRMA